ncbi:hypothetical protein NUW46_12585 [Marinobacter sp. MA]|uniref:hypothetical protein n=1 Tax=Marinobacter sp. MA TaxID=2971606 RepID=UPI003AAF9DCA
MPTEITPTDFTWTPHIFSALMIILGWSVIYRNAKKISSRNETFTIINRVADHLRSIEEKTVEFYSHGHEKQHPALWYSDIALHIESIREHITLLKSRKIDPGLNHLANLREHTSLRCEEAGTMDQESKILMFQDLKAASSRLLDTLHKKFEQRHPFLN